MVIHQIHPRPSSTSRCRTLRRPSPSSTRNSGQALLKVTYFSHPYEMLLFPPLHYNYKTYFILFFHPYEKVLMAIVNFTPGPQG
jgi:hypothetical protein